MYRVLVGWFQPQTVLLIALVASVVWLWRSSKPKGRALWAVTALVGLLVLSSMPLVGNLTLGSLERFYPPADDTVTANDTLVVLSSGMHVHDDEGKYVWLDGDSTLRCLHAAKLYRQAGGCRVILSGGRVDLSRPGPTLAGAMRDLMLRLGLRGEDLIVESRSTNTRENAQYSAEILEELGVRRIVLITDASHLWRATRCFEACGLEVVPASCNHGAGRFDFDLNQLVPSSEGAKKTRRACYEWLGLIWYGIRGW